MLSPGPIGCAEEEGPNSAASPSPMHELPYVSDSIDFITCQAEFVVSGNAQQDLRQLCFRILARDFGAGVGANFGADFGANFCPDFGADFSMY